MLFLSVQTRLCICSAPALRDWRCFLLSRKWETVQWIFFLKRNRYTSRYSWNESKESFHCRYRWISIGRIHEDIAYSLDSSIEVGSLRPRKYVSCTSRVWRNFRLAKQFKRQIHQRWTVTDKKIGKTKRKKAKEEGIDSVYVHNVRVLRGVGVPPGGAAPRRATARRCDYK